MSYFLTGYGNAPTSTYISFQFVHLSFINRIKDRVEGNIGVETGTTGIARRQPIYVLPEPALIATYERGGTAGVYAFVVNLVSSLLREVYGRHGLVFDGRISFSRLVDAGVIDEDTAVYLTTVYMAVEGLFEELEEAEDLGDRDTARSVLREIAVELQKLINILAGLGLPGEMTIVNYYAQRLYQPSNYVTMHV